MQTATEKKVQDRMLRLMKRNGVKAHAVFGHGRYPAISVRVSEDEIPLLEKAIKGKGNILSFEADFCEAIVTCWIV